MCGAIKLVLGVFSDRPYKYLAVMALARQSMVMNGSPSNSVSEDNLILWMAALEAYARDWDQVFNNHPHYFTQEYWYLFVGVVTSVWQEKPLTISAACQLMKTGSARTREDRLKKAVQDGYLLKVRSDGDKRTTLVKPSGTLEHLIRGHLERTYHHTAKAFASSDD